MSAEIILWSKLFHLGGGVGDDLCPAIRESNSVSSGGVVSITLLMSVEVAEGVVVLDSVGVLVDGGLVGVGGLGVDWGWSIGWRSIGWDTGSGQAGGDQGGGEESLEHKYFIKHQLKLSHFLCLILFLLKFRFDFNHLKFCLI